ncbi:MAG: hypothetical protein ACRDL8_17755, partial [Solirubrobacteraceae bacterium]
RNTMQLQYLEVLKNVGASPATKIIVPYDLLGGLAGWLAGSAPQGSSDGTLPVRHDASVVASPDGGQPAESSTET